VVLTKNNESRIGKVIQNLGFCDEVVVIDDYSADKTVEQARELGARVYKRLLGEDFAAQRNFGLKKATNEWVFFVDPDEEVTKKLQQEIKEKIKTIGFDGYQIKRLDEFLGKRLRFGETGNLHLVRLGRKTAGKWQRRVHEVWAIENPGKLDSALFHDSHASIEEFIDSINWYSMIEAKYRMKLKVKTNILEIILFPLGKFLHNYLFKLGFLDGMRGLVMASVMSINSFSVRAKLWQLNK
jgi:glycosyltransferase involved in cell wall biosynthesis